MAASGSEQSYFLHAIELDSTAERAAYLDVVCQGNSSLRAELDALLAAHDRLGKKDDRESNQTVSFAPNSMTQNQISPFTITSGTLIGGRYKLLEEIGEGGMGTVWMAEQIEPVQRRVALKVIKAGMDSRKVVARFEAERQALALMDHPNIARVLDGGMAPDGRPFFVMELVKGTPITTYCDEKKLTVPERLVLFADVCRAVQHAHQKGIIHRDIKPNNVLIAPFDGRPVVKVIDFGVAKATGQKLTEATLFTGFGAIVGTLEYMSPEQAELNNQDVDTRSDIFSLGVLLYELLTGTTPLTRKRAKEAAFHEVLRLVREEEPPKPSTRLSTTDELPSIAAVRGTEPARLSKLVRGDLDWIVMKSLEKDRNRRYETANGFAADVQRYLADEPVQACPPSAGYRFKKFATRNKVTLTTAGLIAAALLIGTGLSLWQSILATQAKKDAVAAQTEESKQRQEADKQRNDALVLSERLRRTLYDSNMNLAMHAWDASDTVRVLELLEQYFPQPGETDLRGFEWYYLDRLCRSSMVNLNDQAGSFSRAAFSPEGRRLAGGAKDGTVKVWDASTGEVLLTINSPSDSVCHSPDGKRLAGASGNSIKIWDAQTGKELLTINRRSRNVTFSPDGKFLASIDGLEIDVWDVQSGDRVNTLKLTVVGQISANQNGHLSYSPNGKRLAIAIGREIKYWDFQDSKELHTLKGHAEVVFGVAFSPDGKRLASCSFDATVRLWDAETGREILVLQTVVGPVYSLTYSLDGKSLAGTIAGRVKVWDSQSWQETQTFRGQFLGGVAFSPDGKHLASGKRVFNTQTEQEVLTLKGHTSLVNNVIFSSDGNSLTSSSLDNTVKLWDAKTGALISTWGRVGQCLSLGFSSNGKLFGNATSDRTISVSDVQSGMKKLTVNGHTIANKVAFSPDGLRLVVAFNDKTMKVWDALAGGEAMRTLEGHTANVSSLAFTLDGTRMASGSSDGMIKVWDMQGGKELLTIRSENKSVIYGVAFSPDGQRLASAGLTNRGIRIWDAQTGKESLTLIGQAGGCTSVAFSPDGKRLASASLDRTVKLWDMQSGREVLTLKGHTLRVNSVVFSPDGHKLASGSGDGTVKIWDATPVPNRGPPIAAPSAKPLKEQ